MFATEVVADVYDLEVDVASADWFDAVNPRTGAKYEIKSTHRTVDGGATGRFRLWEDQHISLVHADASGTAWYAFVLLDEDDDVVDVRRMQPSTVTELVDDVGEGDPWSLAKHREREGRQKKLPWITIVDSR
jgi:hypothetical protein